MIRKRAFSTILLAIFVAAPIFAMAQQLDANRFLSVEAQDPIRVFDLTVGKTDSGGRVCFAFENLTTKNVTSVKFHLALYDQFGQSPLVEQDLVRNAASSWAPGHVVHPPDTNAAGFKDTSDGSQSCWLITNNVTADSSINYQAKIKITVLAMTYDDGSVWQSGDSFSRAYNADGTAYVYVPEPFDTSWSTVADSAPVAVTDAGVRSFADFSNTAKMELCASFRNITNKVATSVKINYAFTDGAGNAVQSDWIRETGTFTQPILIENKCEDLSFPGTDNVRRMKYMVVTVTEVHFNDGSSWTSGQQYVKAYDNGGTAVAGTPTITPQSAAPTTVGALAPETYMPSIGLASPAPGPVDTIPLSSHSIKRTTWSQRSPARSIKKPARW
jgi:hypothetical protein